MFDSDFTREMAKEKILVDWFIWNLQYLDCGSIGSTPWRIFWASGSAGIPWTHPIKEGGRGRMDGSNNNNKQNIDVPASQLIVD